MADKRKYVLEIPGKGEPSTDSGKFLQEMYRLVGLELGSLILDNKDLEAIITRPSNKEYPEEMQWNWFYNLVSSEALNQCEQLLKGHKLDYMRNANLYRLCCDKTTEESENIFLFNYHIGKKPFTEMSENEKKLIFDYPDSEKLLFVYSPVQLFNVEAAEYISDSTTLEDKEVEKLLKNYFRTSNYEYDYNFGKNIGINHSKGIGACFRCYKTLKERLKKEAIQKVDEILHLFLGDDYKFDEGCVEVKIVGKKPVNVHKSN